MSVSEIRDGTYAPTTVPTAAPRGVRALHRIAAVRRQQGVSLRQAAFHMKSDLRTLRDQEIETSDLRLSEIYRWQRALEVPVAELLVDADEPLSAPVLQRARMVRVMKTAATILAQAADKSTRRLAEAIIQQLVEVMPELAGITPWQPNNPPQTSAFEGRMPRLSLDAGLWR